MSKVILWDGYQTDNEVLLVDFINIVFEFNALPSDIKFVEIENNKLKYVVKNDNESYTKTLNRLELYSFFEDVKRLNSLDKTNLNIIE